MFYTVLQLIIPAYMLWYGYKLVYKTPEFGDDKHGVGSWRTRSDREEWYEGNVYAGRLDMIYGLILGIIVAAKHIMYGTEIVKVYNYVFAGLALVAIFSIVPLMHAHLKKKFGPREYVSDNPPRQRDPDASRHKKNNKKKSKKK